MKPVKNMLELDERLKLILAGEHRSCAHRDRDAARKPLEMFAFFGLQPNMSVVDIWPTLGWSTEILAPYLRDTGTLYAAHFVEDHKDELCRKQRREFAQWLGKFPHLYDQVKLTDFGINAYGYAPDASVDMIVTLRNFHNWANNGYLEPALESFFRILKPGGVLCLEEHRANEDAPYAPPPRSFYMREDYVIDRIEKTGLVFDARSEIGANPADTKDYPNGPLSLPPVFWGVDDRAPYEAIGESDRMTLKFRKPG